MFKNLTFSQKCEKNLTKKWRFERFLSFICQHKFKKKLSKTHICFFQYRQGNENEKPNIDLTLNNQLKNKELRSPIKSRSSEKNTEFQ